MNPHFPILLVDGDDKNVRFARRAFRQAALHNPLRVVRDGEQAIAYLRGEGKYSDRQKYPHSMLVLMGSNILRKNGLEVLEWMRTRAEFKEIPTVMLSSSRVLNEEQVQKARRLGITAHLTKALDFKELQHVYKIVVDHWNLLIARFFSGGEAGAKFQAQAFRGSGCLHSWILANLRSEPYYDRFLKTTSPVSLCAKFTASGTRNRTWN
jgi:CheY-like chemotaxis protein